MTRKKKDITLKNACQIHGLNEKLVEKKLLSYPDSFIELVNLLTTIKFSSSKDTATGKIVLNTKGEPVKSNRSTWVDPLVGWLKDTTGTVPAPVSILKKLEVGFGACRAATKKSSYDNQIIDDQEALQALENQKDNTKILVKK